MGRAFDERHQRIDRRVQVGRLLFRVFAAYGTVTLTLLEPGLGASSAGGVRLLMGLTAARDAVLDEVADEGDGECEPNGLGKSHGR